MQFSKWKQWFRGQNKRQQTGYKAYKTTPKSTTYVKPKPTGSATWTEVPTPDWNPTVTPEILSRVLAYSLGNRNNEVSFRLFMNPENVIEYTTSILAKGGAGDVTMNEMQDLAGFKEAKAAGYVCNVHGHTHPDFNAFFSFTDEGQQVKVLKEENTRFFPEGGVVYYLVIGHTGLSWYMRRIEWKPRDGEADKWDIEYTNRYVTLDSGEKLSKARVQYNNSYVYTPGQHQSTRRGHGPHPNSWYQDDDDNWTKRPVVGYDNGIYTPSSSVPARRGPDEVPDMYVQKPLVNNYVYQYISALIREDVEHIAIALTGSSDGFASEAELKWNVHDIIVNELNDSPSEEEINQYILNLLAGNAEPDENITRGDQLFLDDQPWVMSLKFFLRDSELYKEGPNTGSADLFAEDCRDILGITPEVLRDSPSQWEEYHATLNYFYTRDNTNHPQEEE